MTKDEKRLKKYAFRPMKKFSSVTPYLYLSWLPGSARYVWAFVGTILRDFFILQQLQKFHITKRPVINVETEIDNAIPFTPSYVKVYLTFVSYFIKPLDMLTKRFGYRKAAPYICLFLKYLKNIYKNAASIYRYSMSTTTRPLYLKTHAFRTIHFFDPHLLCVPSIHVAIAAGVYAWFKQFYELGIVSKEEADFRLKEIKAQGIAIVESVLFVKQHSVNCIPTALYMLTSTMNKSFFPPEDAVEFMENLFLTTPEITPEIHEKLADYFAYMYDRTLLEGVFSKDWQSSIKHWIYEYAEKTGQTLPAKII